MAGRPKGLPKTGGRAKGTPNRVTSATREAWAVAWDETAPKVAGWLEQVATGTPADADGNGGRAPDPGRAAELAIRMAEYHVPKLTKSEVTGADGGALTVVVQTLAEVANGDGHERERGRGPHPPAAGVGPGGEAEDG